MKSCPSWGWDARHSMRRSLGRICSSARSSGLNTSLEFDDPSFKQQQWVSILMKVKLFWQLVQQKINEIIALHFYSIRKGWIGIFHFLLMNLLEQEQKRETRNFQQTKVWMLFCVVWNTNLAMFHLESCSHIQSDVKPADFPAQLCGWLGRCWTAFELTFRVERDLRRTTHLDSLRRGTCWNVEKDDLKTFLSILPVAWDLFKCLM